MYLFRYTLICRVTVSVSLLKDALSKFFFTHMFPFVDFDSARQTCYQKLIVFNKLTALQLIVFNQRHLASLFTSTPWKIMRYLAAKVFFLGWSILPQICLVSTSMLFCLVLFQTLIHLSSVWRSLICQSVICVVLVKVPEKCYINKINYITTDFDKFLVVPVERKCFKVRSCWLNWVSLPEILQHNLMDIYIVPLQISISAVL